jgi:hypothetical protein
MRAGAYKSTRALSGFKWQHAGPYGTLMLKM